MTFSILFWVSLVLLVLILLAALRAYFRNGSAKEEKNGNSSPIYTSGVYSLVRKSPRESVTQRIPSLDQIKQVLSKSDKEKTSSNAQQYLEHWQRAAELSISTVESGDKKGVQTYRYQVPERCSQCCAAFSQDTYVTREQIHNHPQLVPPFHLGCGVELVIKEAWEGSESGGWSPLLPENGQYPTPEWRTVVQI